MSKEILKVNGQITITIINNDTYVLNCSGNIDLNQSIEALDTILNQQKNLRDLMLKKDSYGNFLS